MGRLLRDALQSRYVLEYVPETLQQVEKYRQQLTADGPRCQPSMSLLARLARAFPPGTYVAGKRRDAADDIHIMKENMNSKVVCYYYYCPLGSGHFR